MTRYPIPNSPQFQNCYIDTEPGDPNSEFSIRIARNMARKRRRAFLRKTFQWISVLALGILIGAVIL